MVNMCKTVQSSFQTCKPITILPAMESLYWYNEQPIPHMVGQLESMLDAMKNVHYTSFLVTRIHIYTTKNLQFVFCLFHHCALTFHHCTCRRLHFVKENTPNIASSLGMMIFALPLYLC